jgi:hypothetical protein
MAGCHVSSVGLRVLRIPAGVFVVGVSAMLDRYDFVALVLLVVFAWFFIREVRR